MRGFTIEQPDTLQEALELIAPDDPGIRAIAGGTGLTPLMKYDFFQPTTLVSLGRLAPGFSGIDLLPDGGFRLGAMSTLRDLERSGALVEALPIVAQALHMLATVRVRNVAQLGGAIAHGHPQMDLPPVLVALGARVLARSAGGERWIDAENLFTGYYETSLKRDELITEVTVPGQGDHRGVYRKLTERTVDDWPMLGIAAIAGIESGRVSRISVAIGAIGDRPIRLGDLQTALAEAEPTPEQIRSVAEETAARIEYRDRPFASIRYQRQLVAVHLRRALESVLSAPAEGRH